MEEGVDDGVVEQRATDSCANEIDLPSQGGNVSFRGDDGGAPAEALRVLAPSSERRRPEKVAEVIARRILTDMSISEKPAGTRLPSEAQMLAHYRVARASLREALRILEIQGIIELRPGPHGGAIVALATSHEFGRMATLHYHIQGVTIRELVEARLTIEPVMAGLAARRDDEVLRERVQSVLADGRAMPLDHWSDQRQVGFKFHDTICAMSGNRLLDLFSKSLKDVFSDRVTSHAFSVAERRRVLVEHDAVAEAVLDHDADGAERLMRAHMEQIAKSVEERHPSLLDEVVSWR
jgi:GntR family transcriptional repressor for pyruvate dehydrogenase complex